METMILLEGGAFFEGPRWHEDSLWLSDMHGREILTVGEGGRVGRVATVKNRPSGLGWLPDGDLLVVSMTDRRLLRRKAGCFSEHADLRHLASHECNDMVVSDEGIAYVGHFGFDHFAHARFQLSSIIAVHLDGTVRIAAKDLMFPNGMVIDRESRTLIVAESYGHRLSAFDIQPDGSLAGRRIWAELGMAPDGICLDAEGCLWVASPTARTAVRVREGGQITHRLNTGRRAIACMLGGSDRRTLFLLTSETTQPARANALRSARVETVQVDVPGAGLP